MEIVDSHVHLYPPELNAAPAEWAAAHGEAHWAVLCTRTRKDGRRVQEFPSVDELLRAMDAAGVARAVLQGWYWERPETCEWQNGFYEKCVRAHPDRLSACAALHPGAGADAARESVRRAAEAGFVGLGELSPHSQGVMADAAARDAMDAALALAGELGLSVCMHVTESAGEAGRRNYPGKVETPLGDFVRWARRHPGTRFVLAHWGARLPLDAEWSESVRNLGNIFYDTAASPLTYGANTSAGIWREMADASGAERVLFGTDYPLVLYPKNNDANAADSMASLIAEARTGELSEMELEAVLGGNAKRVFAQSR
ncbi:putative TIM-barrel fold metal-dependent hydrolase [Ereboglobus sp. PH5-5]|uniref:amidohydrolase family protein n=1 Tax=Ereboglobus sp. PH5-5 TaxID=2940529 RepID=UPI002404A456|nr:TatD family hydrolase [Ereboglobus sp. PH5-5]MDF9832691.1 putative TIM-barrel fold metal-dependent hydrolase [Ereboglobus sp. PH5-5]